MIRLLVILWMLIALTPFTSAQANDDFAAIPILHDGRIKPLDSFARIHLKLFSGKETIDGLNARAWLMETLFDPPSGFERAIFKINDPDIRDLLDLPKKARHLYALAEIGPALHKKQSVINDLLAINDADLSRSQRALLNVYQNRLLYSQILRSMALVAPLSITPPAELSLKQQQTYTAIDLSRIRQDANAALDEIISNKGTDFENYTDAELKIAQFVMQLQILDDTSANNVLFRIIPAQWGNGNPTQNSWMSPWVMMQSGQGSPQAAEFLKHWESAALAYKQQNKVGLEAAFHAIYTSSISMLAPHKTDTQLKAEVFYNAAHPFHMGLLFFGLGIFCALIYALRRKPTFYHALWGTNAIATLCVAFGLIIRIVVLDRPPVSTLFESTLFVALIIAVFALISEWKYKGGLSLFAGAISSALLLSISSTMAVNPDDKEVLVAVLDTNFWLGTHVLIVTAGYGLCIFTSAIAHMYLGLSIVKKNRQTLNSKRIFHAIYIGGLLSLLCMSVGTILGGIWADQSWGRFWGWDPKENGALLIILWLIWVLHGRISGHFQKLDTVALMALLSIIVTLSWFGVNLLSIGLHSYGFIDGIAYGIIAFCTAEIILIGGAYTRLKRRREQCA